MAAIELVEHGLRPLPSAELLVHGDALDILKVLQVGWVRVHRR